MSPKRPENLLLPCALALLLGACGARESIPGSTPEPESEPAAAATEATAPPLETAAEPTLEGPPAPARAGEPAPGQPGGASPSYHALGTEPFWSVRVQGDTLLFTTPEDQAGKRLVASSVEEADGLRYTGQDSDGTAFELRLVRGACSDGMSDRTYAYNATFRYGATDHRGCADTEAALEAQPAP